jgi:uncharacterized protein
MKNIKHPLQFDDRCRTREADYEAHIRDMIEQVLFTAPGERVNRPDFGTGLLQLVFAPNSDGLAITTQILVQGALQQWLGHLILVEEVLCRSEDSSLHVTVRYTVLRTQESRTAEFERKA